jgi:hypothetical protein
MADVLRPCQNWAHGVSYPFLMFQMFIRDSLDTIISDYHPERQGKDISIPKDEGLAVSSKRLATSILVQGYETKSANRLTLLLNP